MKTEIKLCSEETKDMLLETMLKSAHLSLKVFKSKLLLLTELTESKQCCETASESKEVIWVTQNRENVVIWLNRDCSCKSSSQKGMKLCEYFFKQLSHDKSEVRQQALQVLSKKSCKI